ncbi:MAG TPA: phage tail tape measure protein, partial [Candidatus Bathyarchaeia archaeon]|nr:phage tail tape measure protein [Candidatus Bathyarchaeia archaeon]
MAGFAVAGALIGKVLVNSVRRMAEFEEVGSNLSAITGLMGEDLDFLKRKAIEMGGSTTKSSVDTLKAFKLIASAKPELLNNASALAATTKEAIALSEASGLELPAAAEALTTSLNQFSLSADQSSRVINVLA